MVLTINQCSNVPDCCFKTHFRNELGMTQFLSPYKYLILHYVAYQII